MLAKVISCGSEMGFFCCRRCRRNRVPLAVIVLSLHNTRPIRFRQHQPRVGCHDNHQPIIHQPALTQGRGQGFLRGWFLIGRNFFENILEVPDDLFFLIFYYTCIYRRCRHHNHDHHHHNHDHRHHRRRRCRCCCNHHIRIIIFIGNFWTTQNWLHKHCFES